MNIILNLLFPQNEGIPWLAEGLLVLKKDSAPWS